MIPPPIAAPAAPPASAPGPPSGADRDTSSGPGEFGALLALLAGVLPAHTPPGATAGSTETGSTETGATDPDAAEDAAPSAPLAPVADAGTPDAPGSSAVTGVPAQAPAGPAAHQNRAPRAVPANPAVPSTQSDGGPAKPANPATPAVPSSSATPAIPEAPATSASRRAGGSAPANGAIPAIGATPANGALKAVPAAPATPSAHASDRALDAASRRPEESSGLPVPDPADLVPATGPGMRRDPERPNRADADGALPGPALTVPAAGTSPLPPAEPAAATRSRPAPKLLDPSGSAPATTPLAPVRTEQTAFPDPLPVGPALPAAVPDQIVSAVVPLHGRGDGRHEVTLELRPEHLGAIRVEVSVEAQTVHLTLHAADPATGRLLSAALPELRAALVEAGLTAGHIGVGADGGGGSGTGRSSASDEDSERRPGGRGRRTDDPELAATVRSAGPPTSGGLDLFL
jgi:hypothetical protein